MSPRHAITELGRKEDGDVEEPVGLPALAAGHVLPPDLLAFYAICGGLTLRRERVRIVSPGSFALLEGGEYLLAEGTDARRPVGSVAMALDDGRRGWCLAAGTPIAESFTGFLTRLAHGGVFWRPS